MERLQLVKLGGKIISNEVMLNASLSSFASISGRKILVHGGGNAATELAKRMNVPVQMQEGRRITDDAMLHIVTMIYGGLLSKNVVAKLQALGVNGIGLSGADGNIILSDRRPVKTIDYGNVGDIKQVDSDKLAQMLSIDLVPIICALTHDGKGNILNTNADTIAAAISEAMSINFEVELCYAFELNGVLSDLEDENSVIKKINTAEFERMKELGTINEGMIPKIFNALQACRSGVHKVYICNYNDFAEPQKGTEICL